MKRTNKANRAFLIGLSSFVIVASSPAFFQHDINTPVNLSRLPAAIEQPENYVVFATNSVFLQQNAEVLSGSVGVNDESPGPVLDSQVELTVGLDVTTPPGFVLQADRIRVKSGAQVASDVFCNELTNSGSITGDFTLSLDLPLFSTLPPFHAAPAGTQHIEVANDDSIALAAGDYGDVVVKPGGKILFTGGIYNLRSIDARDNTNLLFAAPSEVRVADKFDSDLQVFIGPAQNASIDASDIIFYVAGINGASGNLGATPKAAQIGISSTVLANFYVPNGTLWLRQNTTATGAFWGKDVDVGVGVQVALDNGIVPVDNTPPLLTVIEPVDGSTTSDAVIPISGTVVDATPVTLTVNGDAVAIETNGAFSDSVALVVGPNSIAFVATDAAGNSTTVTRLVTRIDLNLPPDPATVAPPMDNTVATTLQAATEFLYTGANPIQTGVAAGTIDPVRVSVLRGKLLTRAGQPLPGVQITILNHPEFGQTLSRLDGMFDMAVNGGGYLTVNYVKDGYLAVQRQINAPWQDYVMMDNVVMIAIDPQVTTIDFSDSIEVARGSVISDADGTRRATLMFKQGTQATMVLPDGSSQPLTSLNVRATEYTVGATGPMAMPAELPPTSAYTFCVEFSADEAIQAGAKQVQFSQPVPFYVENFLNFSVGTAVPVGWYDREKGVWVPSDDGRVVKMLGTSNGLADLDLNGDNLADDSTAYAELGINVAERSRLATLYASGQSLWRVAITHFTPWDCNWPYGPPDDAIAPNQSEPSNKSDFIDNSCSLGGSIIGTQNQTLGQAVPMTGTGMTLYYQSDRTPGRRSVLEIPLSGSTIPASLKRIELRVAVGGRISVFQFSPAPNLTYNFVWENLRDAYNRVVQGQQPVSVNIGYVYDLVYRTPSQFERSFAQFGDALAGLRGRREITIWQSLSARIGALVTPPKPYIAGWSLDVHHAYEPTSRRLTMGDGTRRSAKLLGQAISTILKFTEVGLTIPASDVIVAADGRIYFGSSSAVYRLNSNGTITRIAGTGTSGFSGDGGPATQARIGLFVRLAMSPDSTLYIADVQNQRIRKISPNGIITTIAGTGQFGFSGDGGPAIAAMLNVPYEVSLGTDGSLYIADGNNNRIRRVGTDGIITTVAGTGEEGYSGDGGLATLARFGGAIDHIEVGSDGSIYISDALNHCIRKVTSDGIITTIAGVGTPGFSGDGGPATAAQLNQPGGLAIAPDGSVYFDDRANVRIRRVSPEGFVNTVVGNGQGGINGDNGPALAAQLTYSTLGGIALGPDGSLYIPSGEQTFSGIRGRIRRVAPPFPGFSELEVGLASEDGGELYIFDSEGKHLRTRDALTNIRKYEFVYDAAGRLIEVIDIDSLISTIERDSTGNAMAIVSPFGQRTSFTLDANGYLASITNPNSETLQFTYTADGLMTSMTDAKGKLYRYFYDAAGLLIRDEDPAGGFKTLSRSNLPNGYEVTLATAEGQSSRYGVEKLSTGDMRYTNIDASGLATVTTNKLDGTTITITPDGTLTTRVHGPDPRFGMEAPLIKSLTVQTPSGLQSTMSQSRMITQMSGQTVIGQIDSVKINGRIYRTLYDGNLKQFTNITPEGRQTVTRVDNKGRVIEESVPGVSPLSYTYDAQGRLTETTQADRRSAFTYDLLSRLASATDPLLRTTTFGYDSVGRITQQVLPGAREILYAYDSNGNLTSLTPPDRPAHLFNYTAVDLTRRYVPPPLNGDTTATRYVYDLDKRIIETIRPDSVIVSVEYDTAGCGTCATARPKTIIFDRGTLNFVYNSTTGLLDSLSAPGGNVITYNYDGTLPRKATWSGEVQGNVEVTYDNNFRVTSQKVNGSNSAGFQYDNDGLLKTAGSLTITRDAQNGRITGTTLGSVTTGQAYNNFGELKSFHALFASDTLFKTVYAQDSLGRITEITETIQGQTRKFNYLYDTAGRLTDINRNDTLLAVYEYDTNGNRLNHYTPNATIIGTYDAQDRLLTYGNSGYTYTNNGDLLMKIVGTDTTRYTYDAFGNLVSVQSPDSTLIEYVIDGQNRRVGKTVNGVLVKRWLYGNQLNIVAELDGAGNLVSRFVYSTRGNVPDYMVKGGVTYRIISDHLGSPRLVINNSNGVVAQRMAYDEFGNIITDTNPGFQPFSYAGGLYDEQTKLVRFGARDYDAETGRWTAKDPVRFGSIDTNFYVYVGNDPINYVDPSGLQRICNRSGQDVVIVSGREGDIPENAVVLPNNQATRADDIFPWDFYRFIDSKGNELWYKVPDGYYVEITKTGEPRTISRKWYTYTPFWPEPRLAKTDPDFNEAHWSNEIVARMSIRNIMLNFTLSILGVGLQIPLSEEGLIVLQGDPAACGCPR